MITMITTTLPTTAIMNIFTVEEIGDIIEIVGANDSMTTLDTTGTDMNGAIGTTAEFTITKIMTIIRYCAEASDRKSRKLAQVLYIS